MSQSLKSIFCSKGQLLTIMLLVSTAQGCKSQRESDIASLRQSSGESIASLPSTSTAQDQQSPIQMEPKIVINKSASDWLTKKDVTTEQSKTVDAILDGIRDFGGPSKAPIDAAKWAERNLQVLALDQRELTDLSPLLAFKGIITLSLTGNNISQEELDKVISHLPNLKTLVKDKGLRCNKEKHSKLTCLE